MVIAAAKLHNLETFLELPETKPASEFGDRERIIEFIETVLLYKFPQMSREEVEAMFTLGDLKKTRVYRDALKEGQRLGKLKGKLEGVKIGTHRGQVLGLKQFAVKLLTRAKVW